MATRRSPHTQQKSSARPRLSQAWKISCRSGESRWNSASIPPIQNSPNFKSCLFSLLVDAVVRRDVSPSAPRFSLILLSGRRKGERIDPPSPSFSSAAASAFYPLCGWSARSVRPSVRRRRAAVTAARRGSRRGEGDKMMMRCGGTDGPLRLTANDAADGGWIIGSGKRQDAKKGWHQIGASFSFDGLEGGGRGGRSCSYSF